MSRRVLLVAVALSTTLFALTSQAQIASRSSSEEASLPAAGGGAIVAIVPSSGKYYRRAAVPRFEIGMQTTMLRLPAANAGCAGCPATQIGVGPALTLNLTRNLALDGVASFFPTPSQPGQNYGGRLGEALLGIKASVRGSKWTLFTKARPGVISWSNTLKELDALSWPPQSAQDVRLLMGRSTYLAMDLGGGIEYRPARHMALRAEVGETFVRLTPMRFQGTPPPPDNAHFMHTLSTGAGVYYRFGQAANSEVLAARGEHRFFDRTTMTLLAMSMLAQAADAITTQRALSDCRRQFAAANLPTSDCAQVETNPIARPFVTHGWAGQLSLGAMVNTAQMLLLYSIHRMGYHRVERMAVVPLTIASGALAYNNLQPK